jgi:Tfp pilus tip-associated adhesin PilY1
MTCRKICARAGVALALSAAAASTASAQVDPLLFMKTEKPNVVFVVDTAARMQRGTSTDPSTPATARATSDYYDPNIYSRIPALWESSLGVTAAMTTYRRLYKNLDPTSSGGDKYTASTIQVVGNSAATYSRFEAATRLAIARAAMYQAVNENKNVARFGLVKMRQKAPATATLTGPVAVSDVFQQNPTETGSVAGKWNIYRPTVTAKNGSWTQSGLLVQADTNLAQSLLDILTTDVRGTQTLAGRPTVTGLLPAGDDDSSSFDTPVKLMLDDAKTEVTRLIGINNDPACRNTIVVLIVGGGEGNTNGAVTNANLGPVAATFKNISPAAGLPDRRVPIYVIALAPPNSDVAALKGIAAESGGQYFEITKAQIDAALTSPVQLATTGVTAPAGTVIVPEVVKAINTAVQHTFATSTDFSATPSSLPRADATLPVAQVSEYQVTSPIVGTVNLNNARDITGAALYDATTQPPMITNKGTVIPQRNNVMVTTGVTMPGFDAQLRAFLMYKPVADSTQPTGWKFTSTNAGQRLWVATTPAEGQRNLFTSDASGNMIAFTTANAAVIAPLMGRATAADATSTISVADASAIISYVRSLPIGAVIDSTPAIMNPPSLDPPPDDAYPGFAVANKGRRTIVWVGTNRGILEAIDARTGLEVWGFIPLNLLPKLRTLRDGQPVGNFDFFVDGSPKISDVNVPGICAADHPSDCWRTHMIVGEGPGGTFYQSFDVTLAGLEAAVAQDSDDQSALLNFFAGGSAITLNWAFPSYSSFDPTLSAAQHCDPVTGVCDSMPYGDLKATASAIEKSVGQTWSDPAVGQIVSASGPYSILVGSGFLPYATQQQANRGGTIAGTTFYILNSKDGTVYASSNIGSDGVNETVDNCAANGAATGPGCKKIKNALQTDPVATGPSDSRFVTKAYLGDLDGNVWRFTIGLDATPKPTISASTKLYSAGSDQPIFNSMATVNVIGEQHVFFGTGSDLLPATDKNTVYHLLDILDTGAASGTKKVDRPLSKSTGSTVTVDERVTAFPAVAGDIVFFTTTTVNPSSPCTDPVANLYAFAYTSPGAPLTGAAAYDTNNDGKFTNTDSVLIKSIAGQRATAPFIVDQHLMFGNGKNVSIFGNKDDFNNGVGQAGVRILSWREVR